MRIKTRSILTAAAAVALLLACRLFQPEAAATDPAPTAPAPTEAATPTPTDTPPAADVIPHYSAGDPVLVLHLTMRGLNEGWAVGRAEDNDHDHILYTLDGGSTWQDVTPPQPAGEGLQQATAYFPDIDTGFVIYTPREGVQIPAGPQIWQTRDRGQTWTASQPLDTGGLEETWAPIRLTFVGTEVGWLQVFVGAGMSHNYTALYQTTDGGQVWQRILDPYQGSGLQACEKTGLAFADPDLGWAGLNCQGLYSTITMAYTANGGRVWDDVPLPPPPGQPTLFEDSANCYTHSPHRFSADLGLVGVTCEAWEEDVPDQYFLYLTDDGGQTWQVRDMPPGALYFYNWYQGYIGGPVIYHTIDRGQTWDQQAEVPWFGEFSFINSQMGWAVGHYQGAVGLYRTTDTGATWEELTPVIGP